VNILPLIFTFLIIFSCIAFSFLKEVKSYTLIETALHGYNRTEQALSNAAARKTYNKIKGEPLEKQEGEKNSSPAIKQYVSRRYFFPALENSKFNLSPLIQAGGQFKLHPFYEPLAGLIRQLYRNNLFSKEKKSEKLEYRLLDAMLQKARHQSNVHELVELFPDDPSLKKLYYQMLKGTNQFSEAKGIPPLGEFLAIQKSDKAVCISFASIPLLKALFGEDISSLILKVEQEKWSESGKYYYFNKQNLEMALVQTTSKASLLTALDTYFNYSKQFTQRELIGGRDKITGIAVTRRNE
jgi:hypothetical protein